MNVKLHRLNNLETRIVNLYSDGKYNEAIELANKLLESAGKAEDKKSMMNAYMNLAGCYYSLGQIESAFENVLEYKQLCDEFGDDRDKYYLYNLSAIIYEFEENYEEAKAAILECIDLALEFEMYHSLCESYNTYSSYLIIENNFEAALKYAQIAMNFAKSHYPSNVLLQCQIYINIASAYIGLEQIEVAKEILDSLQSNPYINSNIHETGNYYYALGKLYKKSRKYSTALLKLNEAYLIFESYNDQVMLKSISKESASIYELIFDFENACNMWKRYIDYSEKLFALRLSSKIKELDIKHSVAAIEKRANIDTLTGVYNRYYLETTCNTWLKDRNHTDSQVCCIVLDIDHFKVINDSYGHLVGDEVIKAVGETCLNVICENKQNSLIGRYGGDEFVAILKNISPPRVLQKARELFIALSNLKVPHLQDVIQVTVSMGVVSTESVPSVKKFTQLFKVADQALYIAKKQGRNQIVFLSNDNCY
ncbi:MULTISPECIES: GGDEF domain-containing protein [Lysinibacillus]|uniref:Diguanylate cyclase n=1 Tax=Lysinibacillus antri TaxID=2498145 RepID=A0A3S0RUR4_9BACI|nr:MULTISPECIES: GGDEF domain-containing protein [Lysinibacillus]RUL50783.1 diguanylate cyclase [Lysinibacillus antri]TSI11776.1 diguanylate cyclase [Lysinibacillus sp. BW-2-10]